MKKLVEIRAERDHRYRYIKPDNYSGLVARMVIHEILTFSGCSTVNFILHSLLLNTKDNGLTVKVKKFKQYMDMSGQYEVSIHHDSHPEGFTMDITRDSLETTFNVEEIAHAA